jgi:drug/metabolite transporter (DMT)-like permease
LVAVLVGVIFLGEGITWNEPVGAALVVLGAAISQGRLTRRK